MQLNNILDLEKENINIEKILQNIDSSSKNIYNQTKNGQEDKLFFRKEQIEILKRKENK